MGGKKKTKQPETNQTAAEAKQRQTSLPQVLTRQRQKAKASSPHVETKAAPTRKKTMPLRRKATRNDATGATSAGATSAPSAPLAPVAAVAAASIPHDDGGSESRVNSAAGVDTHNVLGTEPNAFGAADGEQPQSCADDVQDAQPLLRLQLHGMGSSHHSNCHRRGSLRHCPQVQLF